MSTVLSAFYSSLISIPFINLLPHTPYSILLFPTLSYSSLHFAFFAFYDLYIDIDEKAGFDKEKENERNVILHVPTSDDISEVIEEDDLQLALKGTMDIVGVGNAASASASANALTRNNSKQPHEGTGTGTETETKDKVDEEGDPSSYTNTMIDIEVEVEEEEEEKSIIGNLIEIPKQKVMELLGFCGKDARGWVVPKWAIDPYPALQKNMTLEEAEEVSIDIDIVRVRVRVSSMSISSMFVLYVRFESCMHTVNKILVVTVCKCIA